MTIKYRTDDLGQWGTGIGRNLHASEVDQNFWEIVERVVDLESLPSAPAGIESFEVSGTTFYVHLTDDTVLGPYELPVAVYNARGAWLATTAYSAMDTFTNNGSLYLVNLAHTSASSFDPNATDGSGHDLYSLMIETPGSSLPTGGATGQLLAKSSSSNYAVTWAWKYPAGTGGQYLRQASGTQDDVEWSSVQADEVSFEPVTGSDLTSATVAEALEELSTRPLALQDLTDVSIATGEPLTGALLMWDGSDWTPVAGAATTDDILVFNGTEWEAQAPASTTITDTIQYVIDGGGSVITTGVKGYLHVPFACTIVEAVLLANQSGSIVVDIFKGTYTNFDAGSTHPVSGDKITASAPPTITGTIKSKDTTLTGWTTSVAADSVFAFNVNSVSSIQRVTIALKVTR